MDQLWKWVMHLNAKSFCLAATLLFFGTAAWCGFKFLTPPEPFKAGDAAKGDLAPSFQLGTLNYVSNQLAAETLAIPVDPFRPTIEAIFTNEIERAAFLKALKAAQAAATGIAGETSSKKEDPFAHLRRRDPAANGLTGADGRPMVIPKITFQGFLQRPDGTQVAMFHDSVENSTVFYDAGKAVHGVDLLNANVREAEIRFADGTTRKLEIGGTVELPAEPAKVPPPKKVVPKAGVPVAGAKPGAQPPKPGQKPVVKAGQQRVPKEKKQPQ